MTLYAPIAKGSVIPEGAVVFTGGGMAQTDSVGRKANCSWLYWLPVEVPRRDLCERETRLTSDTPEL